MKKFFCLFLSLLLVFSTVTCFADEEVMTQSEIITAFNEFMQDNDPPVFSNSDFDMSISTQLSELLDNYDLDLSDVNNYFYYVTYNESDSMRDLYFYDLGNSKIDWFSSNTDPETGDVSGSTFYTTGNITMYYCDILSDDTSIDHATTTSVSSIFVPLVEQQFLGLTYNSVVTDSGSSIYAVSSGGLFENIIAVLNSILAFIVPVATGLLAIPLFKFIIYASVALGIIYFVIKLLISYTGLRSLNDAFPEGNFNGGKWKLKDGYEWKKDYLVHTYITHK